MNFLVELAKKKISYSPNSVIEDLKNMEDAKTELIKHVFRALDLE